MKILSLIVLVVATVQTQRNSDRHEHASAPECIVKFSILNAGIEVTGDIEVVKTKIKFDPRSLHQSTIEASADPATIRTGIAIRDKHLKRSDYFDVDKFPVISLNSKSFQKTGKNNFTGDFDLTIKDITRPVIITFTLKRENYVTRYKGSFTINRLDFNLGEQSYILEENVVIDVEAVTVN